MVFGEVPLFLWSAHFIDPKLRYVAHAKRPHIPFRNLVGAGRLAVLAQVGRLRPFHLSCIIQKLVGAKMISESKRCVSCEEHEDALLLKSTSLIVASFVSNNSLSQHDLTGLIEETYGTLKGLATCTAPEKPRRPAVPVKHSVQADFIVCLEDGQRLKMLKRHLKVYYDMTPAEYRRRWSLPPDYPMVAPNYAMQRSHIAKVNGLGVGRLLKAAE